MRKRSAVSPITRSSVWSCGSLRRLGGLCNPRIALANHISSPPTTHNLAIRMTKLEGTNGRYNFHDQLLYYQLNGWGYSSRNSSRAAFCSKMSQLLPTFATQIWGFRFFGMQNEFAASYKRNLFRYWKSRILGFSRNSATPNRDPWRTTRLLATMRA